MAQGIATSKIFVVTPTNSKYKLALKEVFLNEEDAKAGVKEACGHGMNQCYMTYITLDEHLESKKRYDSGNWDNPQWDGFSVGDKHLVGFRN